MLSVKLKSRVLSIALLIFFSHNLYAENVTETVTRKAKQVGTAVVNYSSSVLFPASTQAELAKALGWVNDTNGKNDFCTLCGGYYREFPIPYIINPEVKTQADNYNIDAKKVEWSMKGTSTFSGNAKLIQPNRELTADLVKVRRNAKTGKVQYIDAFGNLHIIEPGLLGLANNGTLNTATNQMTLNNFIYRAGKTERTRVVNPKTGKVEFHIYALNARGEARTAKQVEPHVFVLKNATYTACPPTSNTWKISGSTVNLNYNTGWGSATNAVLYLKNVPVFYFPYYTFPVNHERKTGFLTPSLAYDSQNGATLVTPFYWNMAPNYDYTLIPDMMAKRGVLLTNKFRYLSPTTTSSLSYSIIPHDQLFEGLQEEKRNQAPVSGQQTSKQLSKLQNDSDTRQAINVVSQSQYNTHWTSSLIYNHMSDDYFQNDFSSDTNGTTNQLLQNANLNYASNYWGTDVLVQRYQTLEPIGAVTSDEQYRQLPTLSFNAHTPIALDGLSAITSGAYTDFTIASNAPEGQRIYMDPNISWALSKPFGSITPEISAHLIQDNLNHEATGTPQDPGRAIPSYSLLGNLNFYRDYHLFGQDLKQTVQPQLMYLYTPYSNQTDLPIFDTDAQPLTYAQMFRRNRFSGPDRVGDANQISMGLNSSLLSRETGQQDITAGVATIYYFEDRAVNATCYGATCSTTPAHDSAATENFSPIAGQIALTFSPNWNLKGDWAWSFRQATTASASLAFHYQLDNNHIVNLGYYDVNDAISGITNTSDHPSINTITQPSQDLKQAVISTAWKLSTHWTFLGSVDRNWAQSETSDNPEIKMYNTFLTGFEYDSCCWAMRVVAYRRYVNLQTNSRPEFDNGVFYQFALRGLASASVGSYRTELLGNDIQGFQDQFSQQGLTQGLIQ